MRNRLVNKYYKHYYDGKPLAEVCKEKGVAYSCVLTRLKNHVPEDKLFLPSYAEELSMRRRNMKYFVKYNKKRLCIQDAFWEFCQDFKISYTATLTQSFYFHVRKKARPFKMLLNT